MKQYFSLEIVLEKNVVVTFKDYSFACSHPLWMERVGWVFFSFSALSSPVFTAKLKT